MAKRRSKGAPAAPPEPSGGGFGALLAAKGLASSGTADTQPETKPEPADAPLARGKLVLRYSKKGRGGKAVTLVQGLERAVRTSLAKQLGKAMGCGVRVDGDDLVVQGDQRERLEPWFRDRGVRQIVVS